MFNTRELIELLFLASIDYLDVGLLFIQVDGVVAEDVHVERLDRLVKPKAQPALHLGGVVYRRYR